MRAILSALFAIPALAQATVITIEPDDYSAGTDISNVSPYVTLESAWGESVVATPVSNPDTQTAPTGALTFGSFSFSIRTDPNILSGYEGLVLHFHQPIASMYIFAKQTLACPTHRGTAWAAFDKNDARIGIDSTSTDCGETHTVGVQVDGMRSLVLGGADATSTVEYDHLVFTVPEPPALLLFSISTLVLLPRALLNSKSHAAS